MFSHAKRNVGQVRITCVRLHSNTQPPDETFIPLLAAPQVEYFQKWKLNIRNIQAIKRRSTHCKSSKVFSCFAMRLPSEK